MKRRQAHLGVGETVSDDNNNSILNHKKITILENNKSKKKKKIYSFLYKQIPNPSLRTIRR